LKVLLALILCLSFSAAVAAQQPSAVDLSASPEPDNCEGNALRLDVVRNKAQATDKSKLIIVIARLGKGERARELNRRRLYTVRTYLTAMGIAPQRLIMAEGEPVQGYGTVEVYIEGVLAEALAVGRCQDLPVGMCESDPEDNRLYQMPRRGNAPLCR
jgi:hypothetical protein